jgi:predicted transglutaminase-like cysteine proteinase
MELFGFDIISVQERQKQKDEKNAAVLGEIQAKAEVEKCKEAMGKDKASLAEKLDSCGKLAFNLQEKNMELNALLEKSNTVPSEIEVKLTSKYPKQEKWYSARQLPYADGKSQEIFIDVRDFLATFIDDQLPVLGGKTNDEKVLRCLQWVLNGIIYASDKNNVGFEEFWQFAFETIQRKKGDCDDFAILVAALALKAGVPYFRLRVCAGWVQDPNNENGRVGHLYLTYARESDDKFVIMDGTYFVDSSTLPKDRILHREDKRYKEVWYSFDLKNVYSYSKQSEAQRLED